MAEPQETPAADKAPVTEEAAATEAAPAAEEATADAEAAPEEKREAPTVEAGRTIEVFGLVEGKQFNGSIGVIEEFIEAKQRWKVKFDSGMTKNFKADNLRVIKIKKKKERKDRGKRKGAKEGDAEDGAAAADTPAATSSSSTAATPGAAGVKNLKVAGSMTETLRLLQGKLGEEAEEAAKEEAEEAAPAAAEAVAAQEADEAAPAAEVAEQPAEPKGKRADMAVKLNVAGRIFDSRSMLVDHVRDLQTRLEERADKVLAGEDLFLFYHLVLRNPKTVDKFKVPVKGFRYGKNPNFPSQCFIAIFQDGTEEPISWMKSVKELFTAGGALKATSPPTAGLPQKRPAEEAGVAAKKSRIEPEKELTRAETGLKLLQEVAAEKGHPLASRWEYPLKDEVRRCFAGYLPSPLGAEILKDLYEKAFSGTKWDRPEDPRSGEPLPRSTAWMTAAGCSCTYKYGGVTVSPTEFPPWMMEVMRAFMPLCGLTEPELWPNSCNLNMYSNGQMSVGWHADDEAIFKGKIEDARIISVSLGAERTFELRQSSADQEEGVRDKYVMNLGNGDVCTMEGLTQKYYQHRVPKEKASGPRINFTDRKSVV